MQSYDLYALFCPKAPPNPPPDMRVIVDRVLKETGFESKRANKMSLDEFLRYICDLSFLFRTYKRNFDFSLLYSLLTAFNEANVHFS